VISPLLILISIVYYSEIFLAYNNSMNPPITLVWEKMYGFLYIEQTTHDVTKHRPNNKCMYVCMCVEKTIFQLR
jgi:hypothetical protein